MEKTTTVNKDLFEKFDHVEETINVFSIDESQTMSSFLHSSEEMNSDKRIINLSTVYLT